MIFCVKSNAIRSRGISNYRGGVCGKIVRAANAWRRMSKKKKGLSCVNSVANIKSHEQTENIKILFSKITSEILLIASRGRPLSA